MQPRVQSVIEVAVDFAFSIAINIGGQLFFYHDSATAGRVNLLALLVLTLAFARRLVTRRLFEAYVPAGTRQPQWHSVLEAVSDTLLGFAVAVALQMLVYGEAATVLRASSLTAVLYGMTTLRRYLLRRLFVFFGTRSA